MTGARAGWVLAAVAVAAAVWMAAGVRRVAEPYFVGPVTVVQLPFGDGPGAVGAVVGMDGRRYGPLAFAPVGGDVVVADTFHHRLLVVGEQGSLRTVPLPEQVVAEDLACQGPVRCYVVDGRGASIWSTAPRPTMMATGRPPGGTTVALRRVALTRAGHLLVETLVVGRGELVSRLVEYQPQGALVRELGRHRVVGGRLVVSSGVAGPFGSFQVGPGDHLYLPAPVADGNGRWVVRELDADGRLLRRIVVRLAPGAAPHLLGVDRRGILYVLLRAESGPRRLLAVDAAGQIVAHTVVAGDRVHSQVVGRVTPNGDCLVVENSSRTYRIVQFKLATRSRWKWWPSAPGPTRPRA